MSTEAKGAATLHPTGNTINSRTAERLVKHKWVPVKFMDLTSGCTFRLFEADGTPVTDKQGNAEFIAASKPSVDETGTNTIKIYRRSVK